MFEVLWPHPGPGWIPAVPTRDPAFCGLLCACVRAESRQARRALAVPIRIGGWEQSGATGPPVWRSWALDTCLSLLASAVPPWLPVTCFVDLWSQPPFSAAVPPSRMGVLE